MPDLSPRTPFERLFNPDNKGTLTGLIGRAAGVQTSAERAGEAKQKALEIYSGLVQKGLSPQKAMLQLMQSPEGHNLFLNDPDLTKTLVDFAKSQQDMATAEKPTMTTIGPGQQLYATNPQTGETTLQGSNPTVAMQNFSALSEYAKLDPQTKATIAKLNMLPKGTGGNMKERALQELESNGKISHELSLKILGGVYRNVPVYNDAGEVVGNTVMDMSTGQAINDPLNKPVSSVPGVEGQKAQPGVEQPQKPAEAPGEVSAGAGIGEGQNASVQAPELQQTPSGEPAPLPNADQTFLKDPKKTMYLAAGVLPYMTTVAGGLIGQATGPKTEKAITGEYPARFAALQNHRQALAALSKSQGSMNIPSKLITEVYALSNFGTVSSPSVTPLQAITQHLQLRHTLESEISNDLTTYKDKNLPRQARLQAFQRIQAYQKVLNTIPNTADLIHLRKLVMEGKAGAMYPTNVPGVGSAIKKGENMLFGEGNGKPTIPQMSLPELQKLNVKSLSNDELRAYIARLQELKGKGNNAK